MGQIGGIPISHQRWLAELARSVPLGPDDALPRTYMQAKSGNLWCCNSTKLEALVGWMYFGVLEAVWDR